MLAFDSNTKKCLATTKYFSMLAFDSKLTWRIQQLYAEQR